MVHPTRRVVCGPGIGTRRCPMRLLQTFLVAAAVLGQAPAAFSQALAPAPAPVAPPPQPPSQPPPPPPRDTGDAAPSVRGSSVGYIDTAAPGDQVRLRSDFGYNFPFANRAEFFYAQG